MEEERRLPKLTTKQLFFQLRYLILNEKTFSVFANENIESLIFSLETKLLVFSRKDQVLGIFCLKIEERGGKGGTFCSEDSKVISDWEIFIDKIRNCSNINVKQSKNQFSFF